MTKLQLIGGGKMAEALARGLVARDWAPADQLHVVEPVAAASRAGRRAARRVDL
ncbi:MAG: NAD(P)-binding domain-containing protein [Acidimicrobiales bacterium]